MLITVLHFQPKVSVDLTTITYFRLQNRYSPWYPENLNISVFSLLLIKLSNFIFIGKILRLYYLGGIK